MLVRMHHLILAEEQDLRLSDFLLATSLPTTSSIHLRESNATNFYEPSEPFCNFIPSLVHIPQLYNELSLIICNKWNELLNSYGGSNNLAVKQEHGLFGFAVVVFISFVTVCIDFLNDFETVKDDSLKYFLNLCRREIERKNLSVRYLLNAALVSLHPKNVIESIINTTFWITITWCILLPMMWYKEFMAIVRCMMDPRKYNWFCQTE